MDTIVLVIYTVITELGRLNDQVKAWMVEWLNG